MHGGLDGWIDGVEAWVGITDMRLSVYTISEIMPEESELHSKEQMHSR